MNRKTKVNIELLKVLHFIMNGQIFDVDVVEPSSHFKVEVESMSIQ